ncbi:MAG: carbon-nitrogen hydrolase [Oleiphilaceae bacterium]|nr:carbon-nitrogen hydrolase [Oleiphilaceae bacterium]
MNEITVAALQQGCGPDKSDNLAESERLIRDAASQGARLIVLQELHGTRYFCQTEDPSVFDLAESLQGPTRQRLSALAAELSVVIVGSVFEKRMPGVFHNTAMVLDTDGSLAGCYRKMHIPDDPGFYEKFYFTPGDAMGEQPLGGFSPVDTAIGRLGVLVCWDQWYPEAARLMALAGAEILIYPTAIGWDPDDNEAEKQRQREAWITVQRGHAIANNLPLIAPNRSGHEPSPDPASAGINFWGSSFICGPQGEFLASAGETGATALVARIEPDRTERLRRMWPYLRDRRIDAYQGLLQRVRDHTERSTGRNSKL